MCKRNPLIILLLISLSWVQAKEVYVHQKNMGLKNYWLIQTAVDVPKESVLLVRLWFGQAELPDSRQQILVQKNGWLAFLYEIQTKRALAGEYHLEIVYRSSFQDVQVPEKLDFKKTKVFFWGTLSQQRRDRCEYTYFFDQATQKVEWLHEELRRKGEKYSQVPKKEQSLYKEEMLLWYRELNQELDQLEKEFWKYKYPNVLAPYSLQSLNRFTRVLSLTHRILLHQKNTLSFVYGVDLSLPSRTYSSDLVERFQREVKILVRKIREKESAGEYLDGKDLKKDLEWFNQIYIKITHEYQQNQFLEEETRLWFEQELKDFSYLVDQYERSPLALRYKNFMKNLKDMPIILHLLFQAYSVPDPSLSNQEKLVHEIRGCVEKVYLVVSKEETRQIQIREKFLNEIREASGVVRQLHLDLQENFSHYSKEETLEDYLFWQENWKKQFQVAYTLVKEIQKKQMASSPELPWNMNYCIFCLQQIHFRYDRVIREKSFLTEKLKKEVSYYQEALLKQLRLLEERLNLD